MYPLLWGFRFDGDKFYSYDVDLGRGTDYHPNNLKYDPMSAWQGWD